MQSRSKQPDLPTLLFASAADFEAFLEREHANSPGLHLKFAKKASGISSVSVSEAVEVALCYGWIDGQANKLDQDWWTVRFTPRRLKSIWSKKNVDTVTMLTEEGRMRPSGLAAVEAAKVDGRWNRAYAGPATITVPDDFTQALIALPAASAFFHSLNKTKRYSVLWRLEIVSPRARQKRIAALIQMLAVGSIPGESTKKRKA